MNTVKLMTCTREVCLYFAVGDCWLITEEFLTRHIITK